MNDQPTGQAAPAAPLRHDHAQRSAAGARPPVIPSHEAILNGISDAVIVLDNDWRLVYSNPAATRIWGRDFSKLIGRTLHESLQLAPDNPFMLAYFKSKESGEPIAYAGYSEVFGASIDARGYPHPDGYTILFSIGAQGPAERAHQRARARARSDPLDQPAHLRYLARSHPGGRPARRFSARQPELARDPRLSRPTR